MNWELLPHRPQHQIMVTAKLIDRKSNIAQAETPQVVFGNKELGDILGREGYGDCNDDVCKDRSKPGKTANTDFERNAEAEKLHYDYFLLRWLNGVSQTVCWLLRLVVLVESLVRDPFLLISSGGRNPQMLLSIPLQEARSEGWSPCHEILVQ